MDRYEAADKAMVRRICERIGYGRVMQIASDAWREFDPIGALTVGPCVVQVAKADPPTSSGRPQEELAFVVAQLHHAYHQLLAHDHRWSRRGMQSFADGLIAPQIRRLESIMAARPSAPTEETQG